MLSMRMIVGASSLGIALLYGTPGMANDRGDRPSDRRSEVLQATYAGPEDLKPPLMPSSSFVPPEIRTHSSRGNRDK